MAMHESWHIEPQRRNESVWLSPGDKQSRAKSYSFHRRGFSSILAVIFVSLFSVLGISFFSMTNINLSMADNHCKMAQAQAAAESGLAYAGHLIGSYIHAEKPCTFDQTLSQSDMTDLFTEFSDHAAVLLDGSPAIAEGEVGGLIDFSEDGLTGLQFSVPVIRINQNQECRFCLQFRQYADTPESIEVTSTGMSNNIQRVIRLSHNIVKDDPSLFDFALFARDELTFHNAVTLDGFNFKVDDDPLQVGTNGTDFGDITLKNSATVEGDVIVGAGVSPEDVIQLDTGADITGDTYAMQEEWEPSMVQVPDTLNDSISLGTINNTTTITSSGKYDNINLGNSGTVRIEGNVELYIVGDIDLGNAAALEIAPGGKLTLFLGGNLELKNGADLNNLTQEAENLIILGLDTCESVILKNGSDTYASIFVPNAVVDFNNSAAFYGAVAAESFDQANDMDFHYDAALREVNPVGVSASISIVSDGNSYEEEN